jgi:ubiquinone/menaquinone biosynthesis C-methylase UbiE
LHAGLVAAVAGEVLLSDSAPTVRGQMAARFAGNPRIKVLAPEEVERLPDQNLDLIVSNSVMQYLTQAEAERLLALWRRLLKPGGALIVADVIPPDVGTLSDVMALVRYATHHGFLLAALAGMARTAISPYRKLRSQLGIAQYTEAEFMQKLSAAGFTAERLARNLEHNPSRMTFRARPA